MLFQNVENISNTIIVSVEFYLAWTVNQNVFSFQPKIKRVRIKSFYRETFIFPSTNTKYDKRLIGDGKIHLNKLFWQVVFYTHNNRVWNVINQLEHGAGLCAVNLLLRDLYSAQQWESIRFTAHKRAPCCSKMLRIFRTLLLWV